MEKARIFVGNVEIIQAESLQFQCGSGVWIDTVKKGDIVDLRPFAAGPILKVRIDEITPDLMRFSVVEGQLNLTPSDYLR